MPKLKVITPIEHNGKRYEAGKTLEVDEDTAQPLIDAKAAEAMPVKGQPTEKAE